MDLSLQPTYQLNFMLINPNICRSKGLLLVLLTNQLGRNKEFQLSFLWGIISTIFLKLIDKDQANFDDKDLVQGQPQE